MKSKKNWIAIGIFILTLFISSCDQINANDQDLVGEGDVSENEVQTQQHVHTLSSAVKENVVEPTCDNNGSYDEVVYCSACNEEVSRTRNYTVALDHQYSNKKCVICGIDQPSDGLNFVSNGNGTCFVIGVGSCKDEDIIIPSISPSGDRVTGIAASAFSDCEGLISIRIPDTVTSIGAGAFQGCPDLVSVTLPSNITDIADFMFKNCNNLKNVTIPSRVTRIGEEAFVNCVAFESIVIPANVKVIEKNAFRNFSACNGTVKFENPNGWRCIDPLGDIVSDLVLTDETKTALYLTFRFNDYVWKRN